MDSYFIIWCALFLLAVVFELLSPGLFFFLSFACGCVAAACINFFSSNLSLQLTIFALSSLISLILLRRFVSQSLKSAPYATNAEALIGKKGVVLTNIEINQGGYSKINGEIWFSKSINNVSIKEGETIEVLGVKGSHIIVRKLPE